ncbi:hypothetical protein L195_g012415 [Trifolium pratense]|uniref:Uncharacterized protein n=1 Tax=Trifolium pratense TaxID=57577 RepID=A0A2K3PKA0_TRIPR|nr:hypothetical protein L195_g012415 [Trifolium pratense]
MVLNCGRDCAANCKHLYCSRTPVPMKSVYIAAATIHDCNCGCRIRTRSVFDVAVKVHQNIQERDIEVGRNLGNFILRWLDRMKPSAQIHGGSPTIGASSSVRMTKLQAASSNFKKPSYYTLFKRGSNKRLFTPSSSIWPKPFPTIANMLRPLTPAGMTTHYRNLSYYPRDAFGSNYNAYRSGGVIRKDIQQWMLQN